MRHKRNIPNRGFRVADQIQRDLGELIRELKDPRVGMITVNTVEVTPDYAHAKVYFSLLIGDSAESEIALNEAAGFLRNGLFKRLSIHTVPTLHFHFDRTTERAAELNAMILQANANRAKDEEPPEGAPKADSPRPKTEPDDRSRPRARDRRRRCPRSRARAAACAGQDRAPAGARRAAARQAAGPVVQRRAAEGQVAAARREGRPHRHARPAGHGLLPLCFGAATKFAQVSLDSDKSYRATVRFGQTTRTGDAEGEVVQERPVAFDRAALEAACARWTGPIKQLPPMYSALKHNGKALYEYAREGVEDRARRARRDDSHD